MRRPEVLTFVLAAALLAGPLGGLAAAAPKPDCGITFFQVQTPSAPASVEPGGTQAYSTTVGADDCVRLSYAWSVSQPSGAMTSGLAVSTFTAGSELGAFWVTVTVTGLAAAGGKDATKDAKQKVNVKGRTTLALAAGPATVGGTAELSATLAYQGGGVAGQSITFTVAGISVGSATTDAAGVATLSHPLGALSAGTYPTSASFAGSEQYIGSTAESTLVVSAASTSDTTPPVLTGPAFAGDLGSNGWYVSDVAVTATAVDPESGVTSVVCEPSEITSDTSGTDVTCTATNGAGLTTSVTVTVKRDATAPTITFSGVQEYTVDQSVAITCTATDALSGLASSSCPNASGPAYTFVGANTLSATATDNAGNVATAEYAFNVRVTAASLCNLTRDFASRTLGSSLCAQLNAAAAAAARGNAKASANALEAYAREVKAQTGKAFTPEKAAILIGLAARLSE